MGSTRWHTPAALAWLKVLLQERFGLTFDFLLQANCDRIVISLPGEVHRLTLALNGPMFTRADSELPCTHWNARSEGCHVDLPGVLPAPGAERLPRPLITATESGWDIGYDILGLAYWMLTRQEEVGRTDLDDHGRFPASASHAYKQGYLERPIVDEWLYVLRQVVARTWPGIVLKQHQFSIKVSHDVDSPSLYAFKSWKMISRIMAGHIIKRRDLRSFVSAPYIKLLSEKKLHQMDPYNTFSWLMDVSEANDLRSAFYFICGRTDAGKDAEYEPEHPAMRHLMRNVHARGHEIGLHPSYATYLKPELIKQEAQRLRTVCFAENIDQKIYGGRMHYLRWSHPTTLQAWESAGMAYDSTLGYADHPGFRCGTCFEYHGFNPVTQQALELRLRPLVLMEDSLMSSDYLGLETGAAAIAKVDKLKSACKAFGGCFTLLWHNSSLSNSVLRDLYQYAIKNR